MILAGLTRLGEKAAEEGFALDLAVYGGAALALAFDLRASTLDVDAVARGAAAQFRRLVADVGEELGWPEDWANDAVKGFRASAEDLRDLLQLPGLRIRIPSTDYFIAMKAMAMRIDVSDPKDLRDLMALIEMAGYRTAEEVLQVVERFYQRDRITPRTQFGVAEIIERLAEKRNKTAG